MKIVSNKKPLPGNKRVLNALKEIEKANICCRFLILSPLKALSNRLLGKNEPI